ncbi:hypothetical protein D7D52_23965 [Nocardia yunnanensis]|uniref:Uncharacterized protein n=1 Tax=Nocardia yunnanensis TaxID=2382165 RepID=A0A386ZFZ3_9NOCA|nr:hypothetical protein [Nocardia yunnanensis]AYF76377.1 hypothetical protein D7D52_23965 [Nocardia yunnanensis]
MTNSAVTIQRYADGLYGIVPASGALTAAPGPDTMVLEAIGGHLIWNVLAGPALPAASIDDVDSAQEWVWAVYGESVAVALDDFGRDDAPETTVPVAESGLSVLAAAAQRLAYAHWASRWWPASVLDGIAALDPALLDRDIAALTEECDALVDGPDAVVPAAPVLRVSGLRASDYALAAGDEPQAAGALVLARGTAGWDWRRCPPGLVDASESAVSWQLVRDSAATTVAIAVAAHPDRVADIPDHLRPWARVDTGRGEFDTALRPAHDAWVGESTLSAADSTLRIAIHVPGFGPIPDTAQPLADADSAEAALRARVRDFAAARLRHALDPAAESRFPPLLAEIAAAAEDSDF